MKSNKGFTLVELMIVVMIIGILAAIAIPQFSKMAAKSAAEEMIKTGKYELSKIKDEAKKKMVIEYLEKKGIKITSKGKVVDAAGLVSKVREKVEKKKPDFQKAINEAAGIRDTIKQELVSTPMISCEPSDMMLKKCTFTIEQDGNGYILPLSCERVGEKSYKCEAF